MGSGSARHNRNCCTRVCFFLSKLAHTNKNTRKRSLTHKEKRSEYTFVKQVFFSECVGPIFAAAGTAWILSMIGAARAFCVHCRIRFRRVFVAQPITMSASHAPNTLKKHTSQPWGQGHNPAARAEFYFRFAATFTRAKKFGNMARNERASAAQPKIIWPTKKTFSIKSASSTSARAPWHDARTDALARDTNTQTNTYYFYKLTWRHKTRAHISGRLA